MRAPFIVLSNPGIEIGLQLLDTGIDTLAEGDLIELVQHRLVKAFADTIGLRASCLGAAVIDVLENEESWYGPHESPH